MQAYAKKCHTTFAAAEAVTNGKVKVMAELQKAVGDGKLIVAKDSYTGGVRISFEILFSNLMESNNWVGLQLTAYAPISRV
jgi:hypothetical protein